MQLSRVVPPVQLGALFVELRRILRLLALAFLPPVAVAALAREWREGAALAGVVLFGLLIGGRPRFRVATETRLTTQDGLALAALAYLLFSLAGAVAYWPVAPFLDGLFDAMSGFTTTGLGVLEVASLPRSLLFLRAYSQWIGGAGIVVLSIVLLPGPRTARLSLDPAELKEDNLLGNMVATTRLVFKIYGGLTLAGFIAFLAAGMKPFDALLFVLSTLSTGGFAPYADSAGAYAALPVRLALIAFMVAGAVGFPLYYRARRDGLRRFLADPQLRALAVLIATGLGLSLAAWGRLPATREAVDRLFHVVSALTTTGFTVSDPSSWSDGFRLGVIGLMTLGGSAGSTAGGLKLARVLILFTLGRYSLRRALLPAEAQLPIRRGEAVLRDEELKSAIGFTVLYLFLLAASVLLLAVGGFDARDALFESSSALGTVGLSVGVTSPSMPAWAKLVLIVDMWAGRLEVIPLVVLFYPRRIR